MKHKTHRLRDAMATQGTAPAIQPKAENVVQLALDDLDGWMKRGRTETFMVMVDMTPAMAERLLARNDDNRSLRLRGAKRSVEAYALAMEQGDWQINGQSIIISSSGKVNDGQHRLSAVIAANVTVQMTVIFGVDRDTRHTVDQGAARTPGNILQMMGYKNVNQLATALGFLWLYDTHKPLGNFPTSEEMLELLTVNPKIEDYIRPAVTVAKQFRLSYGYLTAAAYICARVNEKELDSFLHALSTGIGIDTDTDPIFALRKKYQTHLAAAGGRASIAPIEQVAVFLKAFHAFRRGRPVKALRWPNGPDDAFPRV